MNEHAPILVGAGQFCPALFDPRQARSPVELAARAAALALADCHSIAPIEPLIDALAFVRLFSDSAPRFRSPFGGSAKPPVSVARRLHLAPRASIYSLIGGNCPQQLINEAAGAIARREFQAVLICGAEALRTTAEAVRAGLVLDWGEHPPGDCEDRGPGAPMSSEHERRHGVGPPVNTYPLFEHAIRGARRASVTDHLASMARLFARLNQTAADNPHAQFGVRRSAAELAAVNSGHRWLGHPYPKWLNAQDRVDQAAAVILTSVGTATRLGIDPTRWVYLHGCADSDEGRFVLERVDYARSPAMEAAVQAALEMAGIGVREISQFDLYSCFPSAVELACQALKIREDDERDLTVTGGLPFFGGPGNNYSLHAVAEMCSRLRARPGQFGLVLANGGCLSKESCGIYSTQPTAVPWCAESPRHHQRGSDLLRGPPVTEVPSGEAVIETYTVVHVRGVPERGIVIGRLDDGVRFVANTPPGRADVLHWMMNAEPLGARGRVQNDGGLNTFLPHPFA